MMPPGRYTRLRLLPAILLLLTLSARGQSPPQLQLADLPAYHAALSGKATADDARADEPPRAVSFHDLWDQADRWKGRRVTVRGTVVRTFRQDAFGSFPPLVETWLATRAGNLICLVSPQQTDTTGEPPSPLSGRKAAFTGTFLRTVPYAATDQARLAPLIVGDTEPKAETESDAAAASAGLETPLLPVPGNASNSSWTPLGWMAGMVVGLATTVVLVAQHLRSPRERRRRPSADPPLEFLDREHDRGPTRSET